MSKTNVRIRTNNSSYSNPKSKARSRKEYFRKIDNNDRQCQTCTKQRNSKSVSNKKNNVKTSSTHGKVYRKNPEAKTIITTDKFNELYIEIPVVMKWYHRLTKKSKQLIVNFLITNMWALKIFETKYSDYFASKYRYNLSKNIEYMFERIIKHNFNHKKFYVKDFIDRDITEKDIFFCKKDLVNGKKEWVFVMNLSSLYDSYAAFCKLVFGKIPYSIKINHLIYKNTDSREESNIGNYGSTISRFAFVKVNSNNYIPYPILNNLGTKYILYINNKSKRKAMDKNHDYVKHQFNKVVIKEIPLISTPISKKRK